MKYLYLCFFCFLFLQGFSQELVVEDEQERLPVFPEGWDFFGEANLNGMISTGDELPFWMYSNQRGRIYEETNFAARATVGARYFFAEETFFEFAAGGLFRDGADKEFVDEELYAHFQNAGLRATIGRKYRPVVYNGLSASNENILWSLNARPLPGLQLGTNGMLFFREDNTGFGIEASWNEYLLGEDRYMQNARLHHKNLYLAHRSEGGFQIRAGVEHFAHWGGSTASGVEPELTRSYWDAVTFEHPSQFHLTSYELSLGQEFPTFRLEVFYDHIAVDRSGRLLSNTPDGRYGIFYESRDKDKFLNSVIYELYTTHDQSESSTWGGDDYFNHFAYKSGWAYQGKIIGAPFFKYDKDRQRVVNNKFTAHHFGFGGQFSTLFTTYPYKVLLSYVENQGGFYERYSEKRNDLYTYIEGTVFRGFVDLNLVLASEHSSASSPVFGFGVNLRKVF